MENKIFVTRSSMPPIDEYVSEIKDLWDTHWLTNMGVKYTTFQDRLKDYLKVKNVEMLCNGHMALEMTIQALKLSNGAEFQRNFVSGASRKKKL